MLTCHPIFTVQNHSTQGNHRQALSTVQVRRDKNKTKTVHVNAQYVERERIESSQTQDATIAWKNPKIIMVPWTTFRDVVRLCFQSQARQTL